MRLKKCSPLNSHCRSLFSGYSNRHHAIYCPTEPIRQNDTVEGQGYVDTSFTIPKRPKRDYRVNLKRPGYLTMRVAPPASQILVDGKVVGTGYLVKFPVEPGKRKI